MKRTRWEFVRVPRMLRDILQQLVAAEPDMEVVPEAAEAGAAGASLAERGIDVLVITNRGGLLPRNCRRLLDRAPHLRIVVLTPDGRMATVYRLVLQSTLCEDVSPEQLLAAVRSSGLGG